MKTVFKNKTSYSKEAYDKFLEFHRNKYGFIKGDYKDFYKFIKTRNLRLLIF